MAFFLIFCFKQKKVSREPSKIAVRNVSSDNVKTKKRNFSVLTVGSSFTYPQQRHFFIYLKDLLITDKPCLSIVANRKMSDVFLRLNDAKNVKNRDSQCRESLQT